MTYDILIRDGQVVDGTGAVPVYADGAIARDRIAIVGSGGGGQLNDRRHRQAGDAGLHRHPHALR